VAILFAEGSNLAAIETLKRQLEKAGGSVMLIAARVGETSVKGGTLKADGQLAGSPSVLFDAVASIIMPEAAVAMSKCSTTHAWFADAYAHCKTIGACSATRALLATWGLEADEGVVDIENFAALAPARHWDREPKIRMLA
jgi:catalase